MRARVTTTVTILSGSSVDDLGDVIDGTTVTATAVPASVVATRQRTTVPADGRPQVIRSFVGRVPYGTAVTVDDRIRDDRTLTVYRVDAVTPAPTMLDDLRLDMRTS